MVLVKLNLLSVNAFSLDKAKLLLFGKGSIICLIAFQCSKKVNSLPNDIILDWSKLKAFTDDNLKEIRMIYVLETSWRKRENAGYQHFLLYCTIFSKAFLSKVIKSWDFVGKSLTCPD